MKITEETKIKDLIPEGYSFYNIHKENIYGAGKIEIEFRPKEKSFENYVGDFEDEGFSLYYKMKPEHWPMNDKLGLLWHIVRDKGGNLNDFADIVKLIREGVHTISSADARHVIYNILPSSFIESFKEE